MEHYVSADSRSDIIFFCCIALITCPNMVAPTNGQVTMSGDDLSELVAGSTARYSCNPGYVLAGRANLMCTNINGGGLEWNGNQPSCM